MNRYAIDVCMSHGLGYPPSRKSIWAVLRDRLTPEGNGRQQLPQEKLVLSRRRGLGGGAVAAVVNTFIEVLRSSRKWDIQYVISIVFRGGEEEVPLRA